nr:MAG: MC092R [Molluscum contagiosum virus]
MWYAMARTRAFPRAETPPPSCCWESTCLSCKRACARCASAKSASSWPSTRSRPTRARSRCARAL